MYTLLARFLGCSNSKRFACSLSKLWRTDKSQTDIQRVRDRERGGEKLNRRERERDRHRGNRGETHISKINWVWCAARSPGHGGFFVFSVFCSPMIYRYTMTSCGPASSLYRLRPKQFHYRAFHNGAARHGLCIQEEEINVTVFGKRTLHFLAY